MITIFTPTYNRAYILDMLYQSLRAQSCMDFEWLVIDDGSTDETETLFQQWRGEEHSFPIRYLKVPNGGKQRAVNKALELARGEYFFIVDSDDVLMPHAVQFLHDKFATLPADPNLIGISGIKGRMSDCKPYNEAIRIDPKIGYVDATNIERETYGLKEDMAEAFYTEKLKRYVFPVWKNERFTPEAVVWDQIALDGYKLRWFDEVIYLCEYREDGLTRASWKLLKENPMGYAMLFNTQLRYQKSLKEQINLTLQFISSCCLAGEYAYIPRCTSGLLAYLLFPVGWMLSRRRRKQFKMYIH